MVTKGGHGTSGGWHSGCRCTQCRRAHSDTQRAFRRARAQARLPIELRQQLLDAIHAGRPFRTTLRDLGLTPNQVWGLARTDEEWSAALEAALTATRRTDLQHGTNAAYVHGCVAVSVGSTSSGEWGGTTDAGRFAVCTGCMVQAVNPRSWDPSTQLSPSPWHRNTQFGGA